MKRRQALQITPRRIGQIVRSVNSEKAWHGSSRGYKMRINLSDQFDFEGERFTWSIRLGQEWTHGRAGTVFDCIQTMESAANKYRLSNVLFMDQTQGGSPRQ